MPLSSSLSISTNMPFSPGLPREVLIIAEQSMKLHLQLMGQSAIITIRGTSCPEVTTVVYQGTNSSYLPSVIQDPTEFCCTVTHRSRKKILYRALTIEGSYQKKPPKSWPFLLQSSQQQVQRGELRMEKEIKKTIPMMLKISPFSRVCPVCFKFTPTGLHFIFFSPIMGPSFNKPEMYRKVCLFLSFVS